MTLIKFDQKKPYIHSIRCSFVCFFCMKKWLKQIHCWNKKKKCCHICTWWTCQARVDVDQNRTKRLNIVHLFVRWLEPWHQMNAYAAACLGWICKYPLFAKMLTYDLLFSFFVTNLLCFTSRLCWMIAAVLCPCDDCVNASQALLLIIKVHQLDWKVASMATKSDSHHPFCFTIHPQSSQRGHPLEQTHLQDYMYTIKWTYTHSHKFR